MTNCFPEQLVLPGKVFGGHRWEMKLRMYKSPVNSMPYLPPFQQPLTLKLDEKPQRKVFIWWNVSSYYTYVRVYVLHLYEYQPLSTSSLATVISVKGIQTPVANHHVLIKRCACDGLSCPFCLWTCCIVISFYATIALSPQRNVNLVKEKVGESLRTWVGLAMLDKLFNSRWKCFAQLVVVYTKLLHRHQIASNYCPDKRNILPQNRVFTGMDGYRVIVIATLLHIGMCCQFACAYCVSIFWDTFYTLENWWNWDSSTLIPLKNTSFLNYLNLTFDTCNFREHASKVSKKQITNKLDSNESSQMSN